MRKTVILALLFLVAVLAGAGALWLAEARLWARDVAAFRPSTQIVTVAGAEIHVVVEGPAGRGPVIVLDSGLFDVASDWHWIRGALASSHRVVSFDRAGTGWSDELPGGADGLSRARQLQAILSAAGAVPPYVLVGHSIGGAFAMLYASAYPKDVAGLVLLEPVHPDEFTRQPDETTAADRAFYRRLLAMRLPARFGLGRLLRPFQGFGDGLPEAVRAEVDSLNSAGRHLAGVAREVAALEETKKQLRAVKTLGDLPLKILSAGAPPGAAVDAYQKMHEDLLALSTRATRRISPVGDHSSIVHVQSRSRDSVALIQELLEELAHGP